MGRKEEEKEEIQERIIDAELFRIFNHGIDLCFSRIIGGGGMVCVGGGIM